MLCTVHEPSAAFERPVWRARTNASCPLPPYKHTHRQDDMNYWRNPRRTYILTFEENIHSCTRGSSCIVSMLLGILRPKKSIRYAICTYRGHFYSSTAVLFLCTIQATSGHRSSAKAGFCARSRRGDAPRVVRTGGLGDNRKGEGVYCCTCFTAAICVVPEIRYSQKENRVAAH